MVAPCLVYITTKEKAEAEKITHALLQEHLIACANISDGCTSVYRWQGEVKTERECQIIAKTTENRMPDLIRKVREIHSYECPCIVSVPLMGGYQPFMQWVQEQTNGPLNQKSHEGLGS